MTALVPIGECVDSCQSWNPLAKPDDRFSYIDIASVDRETKSIEIVSTIKGAEAPSRARQIVKTNDVLVSTVRPNLNAVAQVPASLDGATASTGFTVLRPTKRLDSTYLFHWVMSPAFVADMVRKATGASYPAVSDRIVRDSLIPLPPLPEQRRIAAILDKADALRAKRRQAMAKLDQLLQSVFLEMFGDPVTNPKGWPIATVETLATFITSGSRGWAKYYAESGTKFIRIQNLIGGNLDLTDCAYVNAPETAEAKRTRVREGDILVSITADLGRTAVVPPGIGDAYINQHIAILRLTGVDPTFAAHYLASAGGKHQFDRLNRAGVKAGLNFNDLRALTIAIPPIERQHQYLQALQVLRTQSDKATEQLQQVNALAMSLQTQAFMAPR